MTFDEYKQLDELAREQFLKDNGVEIYVNHDMCDKNAIDKLQRLHSKAIEDLKIWLYYADCSNIEEFYEKSEVIKKISFHKYSDVLRQLKYIRKLENKIQKSFEDELTKYMENFIGEINYNKTRDNIKYNIESILRKYSIYKSVKVIGDNNCVNICEDFTKEIK